MDILTLWVPSLQKKKKNTEKLTVSKHQLLESPQIHTG